MKVSNDQKSDTTLYDIIHIHINIQAEQEQHNKLLEAIDVCIPT